MGNKSRFDYEPKTYRLRFDDEAMAGLVVEGKGATIRGFRRILSLAARVQSLMEETPEGDQDVEAIDQMLAAAEELFGEFATYLISWNLHVAGRPVPCDADGLLERDLDFAMAIVEGWMQAVSGVSPPLPGGSSSTPPSELGLSQTMAPSSPSPAS